MTTLLIRLVRHDYKILGGFLLIEHSYDYPINPAYTPGMKYYLGAPVNEQSFVVPCNRLGRQVYSPKIRVILPLFACHSDQVILE